jgi:hypothetical protein
MTQVEIIGTDSYWKYMNEKKRIESEKKLRKLNKNSIKSPENEGNFIAPEFPFKTNLK